MKNLPNTNLRTMAAQEGLAAGEEAAVVAVEVAAAAEVVEAAGAEAGAMASACKEIPRAMTK